MAPKHENHKSIHNIFTGVFIHFKRVTVREKKLTKLSKQLPLVCSSFIKAHY